MRHTSVLGAVVLASHLQGAPPPAPAAGPAPAAEKETAGKAGWINRMANAPKKLAFWNKDGQDDSPSPARTDALPAATPQTKAKPGVPPPPAAAAGEKKPAKGQKPDPAPAKKKAAPSGPAAEPVQPEAEKKPGFLSRLPRVPFLQKETAEAPDEAVAAATSAEKKPPTAKKAAARAEAPPAPPVVEEEKDKPGFLSRIWGGGKEADAVVADSTPPARPEKLGPAKPGAAPAKKTLATATPAAAEKDASEATVEKKPSFWVRMTSSVTSVMPSLPERPKTTPIVRGALPGSMAALTSSTFVITKDDSPFYLFGPNQATPPDAYLATGTIVTLTEKNWGWAEIRLSDGRSGIVARDALRLATAFDIVPETAPATSLMASVEPPKLKKTPVPSFVLPDVDLPELPEPDPELVGPLPPGEAPADAETLSTSLLPPFEE